MYYVNVAPGTYVVTYRFYLDCSGVVPPRQTFDLAYSATGCGPTGAGTQAGGVVTLRRRSFQPGNPYCNLINNQAPCDTTGSGSSTAYPNYAIFGFDGILTLGPDPAAQCTEWRLSTEENARPETYNLTGGTLYSFLLLNNRDVADDSSPRFSTLGGLKPLITICDSSRVLYNGAVVDPDGDSLVYSAVPAYTSTPLPGGGGQATYRNGFTPTAPVRIAGPIGGQPALPFTVNRNTGAVSFTAGNYFPGSVNDEDNKFTVVVQVDAYRRVNGQIVKTATVRRDIAVTIHNCLGLPDAPFIDPAANALHTTYGAGLAPATNSAQDTLTGYLNVPMTISFAVQDINRDSLYVDIVTTSGASLAVGPLTMQPTRSQRQIEVTWTPTTAPSQPVSLYVRAADNGCPIPSTAWYTIPVRILTLRPTGIAVAAAAPAATAAPNPFSTEARLTLSTGATSAATDLLIYDATGRQVDRLSVPAGPAGVRTLTWQPRAALAAGLYYARYAAPGQRRQTLVLQKQ